MDTYPEFIVKNAQALKVIADSPWWSFVHNEVNWIVKGKAMKEDDSVYSMIITDLNNVYFTVASTTQIQKEVRVSDI